MAVVAGRTNNLFGWNAYDWAADYKYVAAGWTVDAVTGAGSKDSVIAITPPTVYPYAGAVMGVLYGVRSGQGYDRKSSLIAAATAGQVRLSQLSPLQSYYLIPVMRTADGQVIRGPEVALSTLPLPPPVISGVSTVPAGGACVINWTTNVLADERIDYGTTTAYGSSQVDPVLGTVHTETIQPLLPATLYHYKITSRRDTGEVTSTTDATFTTL